MNCMHELALMQGILDVVTKNAHSYGLRRITKIKLVIGKLRAVVPDSLEFCFTILKEDIPLIAQGELEVEIKEIEGSCRRCSHQFLVEGYRFRCPQCECTDVAIVSGSELYVDYIEGD